MEIHYYCIHLSYSILGCFFLRIIYNFLIVGSNIVTCLGQSRHLATWIYSQRHTLQYKSTQQTNTKTVETEAEEERNNQMHAH